MADVSASWNRIISWLESNAATVVSQHQPGVTESELDQLEQAIGAELPEDFKQFLGLVNGDNPNEASSGIFPSNDDFDQMSYGPLAASKVKFEWETQRELLEGGDFEGCEPEEVDPGIRNVSWNIGWIPFAGNGGGDLYCIDLMPGEGGSPGQIISHSHESFDHKLLATSFADYLNQLADDLENGVLAFSDEWGVHRTS